MVERHIPWMIMMNMGSNKRMPNDIFNMVAKSSPSGLLYAPDAEGQPSPSTLMRPIQGGPISDLSQQYLEDGEKNIDNSEICA